MIVLGIETSCDETAASVVVGGKTILSNVLYSQIEAHKPFGGVFPELASRTHVPSILPIIDWALKEAKISLDEIDLIAVSSTPGLMGSLLIGVNTAKSLAYALNKPFVGVNHIEAHLYAAMMSDDAPEFPALGLVISGGHTSLFHISELGHYSLIGSTVDDAVGEAFDKVARLLELPYPGGPEIEKLAKRGTPLKNLFSIPRVKDKPFAFSFSGLKTQVFYTLQGQNGREDLLEKDRPSKETIAASFQETALTYLVKQSVKALTHFGLKNLYVGGGVSHNRRLRELFKEMTPQDISISWPLDGLSLDNAAMVAGLGYHVYQKKGASDSFDLAPSPTP